MKKLAKILLVNLLFVVGLVSVNAAPFKITENASHKDLEGTEYASLKEAVDAAPADNSLTIIEMTEDVAKAAGVQVVAGKNLVIDFGGHTYETWEPMVGSKGTETQSFQLLKGATVYMKNGTLVASTHEKSKMFIQNYADLTLDNITIDATNNTYDYFYAVSANNGEVIFRGKTNIYVNTQTHARVFDMCWAPKVGYPDGTQIVIDTTGTLKGIIELDLWGDWEENPKSSLLIKNGNFDVKWDVDERLSDRLTLEGGTFKVNNENDPIFYDEHAAIGKGAYSENDSFVILNAGTVEYAEQEIYLLKGKTYTLTPKFVTEGYTKYINFFVEDDKVATFKNGVITGVEAGNTILNYNLGRLGGGIEITVFEVNAAKSEDEEIVSLNENANNAASNIVEKALTEENVEGIDSKTLEAVKAAVIAGKTIETEVAVEEVKSTDLDEEVVTTFETQAKKADGKIAGYLDIDVLLKADSTELGKVTKLSEPISITVDAPTSLGDVPANMKRTYFVVRLHEGEDPTLIEATYKDGKLTFETDRFSQYAYGYADTSTKIPQTGDNIALYLTLLVISGLGIAGTAMLSRKRLVSISK